MLNRAARAAQAASPALFFILILALWEMGFRREWWNPRLFPGPFEVWRALVDGFGDGSLPLAIKISSARLGLAYTIALLLGTLLGFLSGTVRFFSRTVGAGALGLQTLPSICWLPLAIAWFGLGERAIFFVTLMGGLLAITIAVSDGIKSIPPPYLRAAMMMGAGGLRLYREVMLPAALPSIITGAKQGWAFAWRSLMAGELLSASARAIGLGQTLTHGRENHNMSLVLAVMVVLIGIGMIADRLVFGQLEGAVRKRWGLAHG